MNSRDKLLTNLVDAEILMRNGCVLNAIATERGLFTNDDRMQIRDAYTRLIRLLLEAREHVVFASAAPAPENIISLASHRRTPAVTLTGTRP